MDNRSLYRELCEREPAIPFFSQAWWLDVVAEDRWNARVVEKGGEVIASLPYAIKAYLGMPVIYQPPLTQFLGPWIRPGSGKYAKRLSREKQLMDALIEQLPNYQHFSQSWHYTQTNWLPFYWKGFSQTTRYTYRIENLKNRHEDEIWAGLQQNIRAEIKKASTREKLKVRDDLSVSEFYKLNAMVFRRQDKKVPYSEKLVNNLDRAAASRGCRKIFIAEDDLGRHHAGVYLVWDQHSAYYLMGGGNPDLRNSGATSLCMWEAIKFASSVTQNFDFEGSMLEPVERFFRAFGAVQTPYHRIVHTPSRAIKTVYALREALR